MVMNGDWIFDCGNTTVKWAVFRKEATEPILMGRNLQEAFNHFFKHETGNNPRILIAASGRVPVALSTWFKQQRDVHHLYPGHDTGVPMDYDSPETLGLDRIANVAEARTKCPSGPALILDVGTCLTFDWMVDGVFCGGSISPGLDMRLQAMAKMTASLPHVGAAGHRPTTTDIGRTTSESMRIGAWAGLQAEINGRVNDFGKVWPDLSVFLTGGNANHLQLPKQYRIFADPMLTLKGFRAILKHIANHKPQTGASFS